MQLNPDFSPEQRQSLESLVDSLRETLRLSVSLNSDPATLEQLNTQLRALNEALRPHAGRRALEHFNASPGEDLAAILPCSPVTGRYHPMAPPFQIRREAQQVVGEVTLNEVYEGPQGHVHGAWVAAIYDQLLAMACVSNGTAGPTANLSVDYLKPTPLNRPLRFEASVDSADERKIFASGRCYSDGELVSRCEGLFIRFIPRQ
ncbi:MAG: hypothetical protein CME40_16075 [Haliea sp.]|nr:hypothetical protein [Haliea sp.]MAL96591.1 hypothetical protein [Haliea sp.]|tara:strand:+ start:1095 stop:1706 length:612 start_codon:yes stop_codon:yes gene_type:complete